MTEEVIMSELKFDREQVVATLSKGAAKISFYKLDGSLREMTATLSTALIPKEKQPISEAKATKSSTVVPVFDVDAGSWKSFLFENLVTIE